MPFENVVYSVTNSLAYQTSRMPPSSGWRQKVPLKGRKFLNRLQGFTYHNTAVRITKLIITL